MMIDLLDTDVMIDLQHALPAAVAWLAGLAEPPGISGYVAMELIQDARDKKDVKAALDLTKEFSVVWPNEAGCKRALDDFTNFHLSHNLGLIDSLIAATATTFDVTLYTFNTKHYKCVPGLRIAKPYKR